MKKLLLSIKDGASSVIAAKGIKSVEDALVNIGGISLPNSSSREEEINTNMRAERDSLKAWSKDEDKIIIEKNLLLNVLEKVGGHFVWRGVRKNRSVPSPGTHYSSQAPEVLSKGWIWFDTIFSAIVSFALTWSVISVSEDSSTRDLANFIWWLIIVPVIVAIICLIITLCMRSRHTKAFDVWYETVANHPKELIGNLVCNAPSSEVKAWLSLTVDTKGEGFAQLNQWYEETVRYLGGFMDRNDKFNPLFCWVWRFDLHNDSVYKAEYFHSPIEDWYRENVHVTIKNPVSKVAGILFPCLEVKNTKEEFFVFYFPKGYSDSFYKHVFGYDEDDLIAKVKGIFEKEKEKLFLNK